MLSTEKILDSCFDKEYTTLGFEQGARWKEGTMPPRTKLTKRPTRRTSVLLPPPIPDPPPMGGPSGAGYAAEARFAFFQSHVDGLGPPRINGNNKPTTRRKRKSRK